MKKKNEGPVLSEKDQEIIAVGASVASGCLPCTKFHLKAAASVGASKDEIRQAVADATQVRRTATELMAKAGGLSPADEAQAIPDTAGLPSRIRELTAAAAAYAVNCSANLGAHMTAARALGATDRQMFAAIKIACAVRDVACQKAKATAGSILGVSEEQAVACACSEADATSTAGAASCSPDKVQGADNSDCCCPPGNKAAKKY